MRRRIFSKRDEFSSVEEARCYFKKELKKLNLRPQVLNDEKSAYEMLLEEKPYLIPACPRYDSARIVEQRADKYSTITVDSCHYSVPDSLVGEFIFVKIYSDSIICYYDSKEVAQHKRKYGKFQWSIDIAHYIGTLKLKPGALKRSTAFVYLAAIIDAFSRKIVGLLKTKITYELQPGGKSYTYMSKFVLT